jgi:hypothetical protein
LANSTLPVPSILTYLEGCLGLGVRVDDPPPRCTVTFAGWLTASVDHPLRNQDIVGSAKDERFKTAIIVGLEVALACRGGAIQRGYGQPTREQVAFPLAARDRPGIKELWRQHTSSIVTTLEQSGLASLEVAQSRLASTLWPDTLRLFPDLAKRLRNADSVAMLQRTLRAGVFDEYGLPALEETAEHSGIKIQFDNCRSTNIHIIFPNIILSNDVHAFAIGGDGKVKKHEALHPVNCRARSHRREHSRVE